MTAESENLPELWSRRDAFALLGLGSLLAMDAQAADAAGIDGALADRFALKRRAYQSGDAELLRSFYDEDILIVGEGMAPLLGIEQVIAAYRQLLPKRRDIQVVPLRSGHSPDSETAYQFVRFTAFSADPAEVLPIVTFLFLWRHTRRGWRCVVELLMRQDLSLTPGFARLAPASSQGDRP